MPLVVHPGTAEVFYKIHAVGDPEAMTVSLAISTNDPIGSGLAAALDLAFRDNWLAALGEDWEFRGVHVTGQDDGGNGYEQETVSAVFGTNVSSMLPVNCAALIRKRTGIPGRDMRGRLYLPGVVQELEVDQGGNLSSTMQSILDAACAAWKTDIEAIDGIDSIVLLHNEPLTAPTAIAAIECDPKIATQRRRLR